MVYGERHLGFASRFLLPHDFQGLLDTLCPDCYPIAGGALNYFERNPYHSTLPLCFRLRCVSFVMTLLLTLGNEHVKS